MTRPNTGPAVRDPDAAAATRADKTREATHHLTRGELSLFIGRRQKAFVLQLMGGEEGEWFAERMILLADQIAAMPVSYQTEKLGKAAPVVLHYFGPSYDAWITEKDKDGGTPQAFGKVDLGYGAELGNVCIDELLEAGAELDFHWTPVPVGQVGRD